MPRYLVPALCLVSALVIPAYAAGQDTPITTPPKVSRAGTPLTLVSVPAPTAPRRLPEQLDPTRPAKPATARGTTPLLRHMQSFTQQNGRSSQNWGGTLTDIARHLPADQRYQDAYLRYTQAGDLVTAGHEWTHFLNEALGSKAGVGKSAYYVLENRYVTLADPEGLRGIVPNVPPSLRSDLYDLYLVQNSGNARVDPLYLFDEWTAYTNDVTVAVDQLEQGKPLDMLHSNIVQSKTAANVLEFMFYGFAVGMAVKAHDPAYYASENGSRLREFIAWNARRSLDVYGKALRRQILSEGDPRNALLMRNFRGSPDTAAIRTWVRSDLGEDLAGRLGVSPGAPVAQNEPSPSDPELMRQPDRLDGGEQAYDTRLADARQ